MWTHRFTPVSGRLHAEIEHNVHLQNSRVVLIHSTPNVPLSVIRYPLSVIRYSLFAIRYSLFNEGIHGMSSGASSAIHQINSYCDAKCSHHKKRTELVVSKKQRCQNPKQWSGKREDGQLRRRIVT